MTQTNVPINKSAAYMSRVDVDSFMSGSTEQQQRNADPHNRYFNFFLKI